MYPLPKFFILNPFQPWHQPRCPVGWVPRAQCPQQGSSEKTGMPRDLGFLCRLQIFTKEYREKLCKCVPKCACCTIVHWMLIHGAHMARYLGHSAPMDVQVKICGLRHVLVEKFRFEKSVKQCKKPLNVPLTKNFQVEPVPTIASTKVPSGLGTSGTIAPKGIK